MKHELARQGAKVLSRWCRPFVVSLEFAATCALALSAWIWPDSFKLLADKVASVGTTTLWTGAGAAFIGIWVLWQKVIDPMVTRHAGTLRTWRKVDDFVATVYVALAWMAFFPT